MENLCKIDKKFSSNLVRTKFACIEFDLKLTTIFWTDGPEVEISSVEIHNIFALCMDGLFGPLCVWMGYLDRFALQYMLSTTGGILGHCPDISGLCFGLPTRLIIQTSACIPFSLVRKSSLLARRIQLSPKNCMPSGIPLQSSEQVTVLLDNVFKSSTSILPSHLWLLF